MLLFGYVDVGYEDDSVVVKGSGRLALTDPDFFDLGLRSVLIGLKRMVDMAARSCSLQPPVPCCIVDSVPLVCAMSTSLVVLA